MVVCHGRRVNDRTIAELAAARNWAWRPARPEPLRAAPARLRGTNAWPGNVVAVNGPPVIVEFPNGALTAGLTAINQTFAPDKLCQNWGWKKLADVYRHESIEEMALEHGDPGTRELLEHLVVGEEQHLDWIETELRVVADIGIQLYLQAQHGD